MNFEFLDEWLERLGERINPILVKETRQALKSRQFSITFLLLLAASLLVSFGGVALSGPGLNYRSAGSSFFIAYFVVLAFAVFVVVPFGAYRSLATEQDERTYELISISTMKPRQILGGKLLSAIIQMFIYFSAVGPFLTFTLLLKGIDALAILLVLGMSMLISIGLSMLGLLIATLSDRKGLQVFFSVVIIAALLFATFMSIVIASVLLMQPVPVREPEFWTAIATCLTVYATYFMVAFQVASARLTFESDNRSTKVRVSIGIQFLLCLGWITYWWFRERGGSLLLIWVTIPVAIHWFVVGSFLIAESSGLSQRVARQVPRQALGRALTALLFPGPATGLAYLFMNLVCLVTMVGFGELTAGWLWPRTMPVVRVGGENPTLFVLAMASYVFVYCGLGAMLIRTLRRRWSLPAIGGATLTWLLAALGSVVPNFFALVLPGHQFQDYRIWQISDPIATLAELYQTPNSPGLALIPAGLALLVLLLSLRAMGGAVREIITAARQPITGRRVVDGRKSNSVAAVSVTEPTGGT